MTNSTTGNSSGGRSSASGDRSLVDDLEHAAPELKARAKELVATGKERIESWKEGACDRIRDQPMKSVLIATAVGALLGLLLFRRRG